MNRHPTDPAQLARWLRTPRTGETRARLACAIEHYQRNGGHLTDFIIAGILVAVIVVLVATWGM